MSDKKAPFVWNTFESYSKEEVDSFMDSVKPDIFQRFVRRDIVDLDKVIYVLKWWRLSDENNRS